MGLRTHRLAIGLALSAFLIPQGCGGSPTARPPAQAPVTTTVGHVMVAGVQRAYVIFRPAAPATRPPAPLVIAMHGYTVDSTWMESNTHFDDLAAKDGFVVIYPQGEGNAWNAGRCCGHDSSDDVAFISALIDQVVGDGLVDPKRVYATGLSNGAFMAQRLACELANRIAAVASVSGSLVVDSCEPARPISVLEMHGVDDELVPYGGGVVGGLTSFPPTMVNMARWAMRDGCGATPATSQRDITTTYIWSGCRGGSVVELEAIAGAGHSWFSPDEMPGEPDSNQTVWDFFDHSPSLS